MEPISHGSPPRTAGFVYVRLHGAPETYASRYEDDALEDWAERVRRWRGGVEPEEARKITGRAPPRRKSRDVSVYFDNDARAHAPRDAVRLRELLLGGRAVGGFEVDEKGLPE